MADSSGSIGKRECSAYDPKTQKLSDYVLYFRNKNFHRPNHLISRPTVAYYFHRTIPRAPEPSPILSRRSILPSGRRARSAV